MLKRLKTKVASCNLYLIVIFLFLISRWPCVILEAVKRVLRDYHERICALEDSKYDIEIIVKRKDFEVLTGKDQPAESYNSVLAKTIGKWFSNQLI